MRNEMPEWFFIIGKGLVLLFIVECMVIATIVAFKVLGSL